MDRFPQITLASNSPRRAALLSQMGFSFQIMVSEISEESRFPTDPVKQVKELSERKARAVLDRVHQGLIIGADTVVSLEGRIFGKPVDKQEAKEMLSALSGRTHTVSTGFTLIQIGGKTISDLESTSVTFRKLDQWEIEDYVESGEPMDKAGAYGIQDRSGLFVERIDGCFYNVVGFPLTRFFKRLKQLWDLDTLRQALTCREKEVQ